MKEIVIKKQDAVIDINFEEVKASLVETMDKYKGIVVTEEGLKDCKATQKELAGLRNKIDGYRKEVKREMEAPIKEFEGKCKELIALVGEVEKPIKEGITVFDDTRRLEKVKKVNELIIECVQAKGLNDKYKAKIGIHNINITLTNSIKSIKEEIETKVDILLHQQIEEEKAKEILVETIKATLESVNTTIKKQLTFAEYEMYIDMGWSLPQIVKIINNNAEMIRKAEEPKPEPKEEVAPGVEEPKQEVSIPMDLKPVNEVPIQEDKWFVDIKVTHNKEMIMKLSEFLKANNYEYEVNSKGKCE